MLAVKLVKLKSSHGNLRTEEVVGKTTHIPKIGGGFMMFAPPLESGSFRTICTTEIQTCEYFPEARKFFFTTLNSEYALYVLQEDKDPFDYERIA